MVSKTCLLLIAAAVLVNACSNIIVSPGASEDGSSLVAYNADSHTLYGALYFWPHAKHSEAMVDVVEWDTGKYLGQIPQVPETYNVIGNTNEYQVSIGETTFEGLDILQSQNGAIVDYGSLIYLGLQRSKSAREAILTMADLVSKYGYYSSGESFSVADKNEAWIFEMIGKGNFEMGAVWVAIKLPQGAVCSHANQARIMTFNFNDTENVLYAPDVVSFAQAHGFYPADAPVEQFSFSDAYNPVSVGNARQCDGRVWSVYRYVTSPQEMDVYLDYVTGTNLSHRLPLFVFPTKKVAITDVMKLMGDHYEGTPLEFDNDVGAAPFDLPYRWRPMDWSSKGVNYFNERAIGTQQTGFAFVAQSRAWLPDQIGSINWFGVDDGACTVRVPFYSSITQIPKNWANDYANMMNMKFDSAFFAFNLVCNFAYSRWNLIYPDVAAHINDYQTRLLEASQIADTKAQSLYAKNPQAAVDFLTTFSNKAGIDLVDDWQQFFKYLFTKYMDGNLKVPNPPNRDPLVQWPGYPQSWYDLIAQETGDRYVVPTGAAEAPKPSERRARYM